VFEKFLGPNPYAAATAEAFSSRHKSQMLTPTGEPRGVGGGESRPIMLTPSRKPGGRL
jgi:hypothetical protein